MSKAGAVGGITPAIPAGPQDGGAKAAVQTSDAKAAEGKSSAPPLAEASNRAPPDAAVELSAAFAGLKPGQELRGTVRLLPGQPHHALLKTPQGEFLIEPAAGLEPDSRVSVVLTRADRAISAFLLTAGGKALDVPRPVQLTLVSLAPQGQPAAKAEAAQTGTGPAPAVPTRADGALVQPAPAQPAPAPPAPPAPSLTSLLPEEAIPLRGGSHLPQPLPGMPAAPAAHAAAPSLGLHTHNPVPHRPGIATAPMPPVPLPSAPQPAAGLQSAPINGADPLAALFDRGVMPLTLQTGVPNALPKTLSASLLATTAPGETSPLAQPPANSPLARLAESGRLVTATALPPQPQAQAQAQPQAQVLPGAQAPAQPPAPGSTAPTLTASGQTTPGQTATPSTPAAAQSQPVQLAINGTAARLALPAGVPAPQPGTQLVFLVTAGHEALRTLPAAPVPPQSQPQAQPQNQTQAQPPQAQTHAAPVGPSPATVSPSSATPAAPASLSTPANPTAPALTPSAPTTPPGADARPVMPAAPDVRTDGRLIATTAPAAARAPAPAGSASIPEPPMMAWVPGMPAPMTIQPAASTTLAGGEALLMAVMQALGRKGFAASPRDLSNNSADADGVEAGANAPLLARLLHAAATSATTAAARAEQAQEAPPATAPDALPFVMTLQTPQGQIPLVFLVWQPVRGDEESNSPGADGEADVCFAVEVEFESIGRLRLRGSVGPAHLNLGVETEQPLGAALQQAARRDFTEAVEAGGMTGTLVFRRRDAAS